jgi:hypothetical protein
MRPGAPSPFNGCDVRFPHEAYTPEVCQKCSGWLISLGQRTFVSGKDALISARKTQFEKENGSTFAEERREIYSIYQSTNESRQISAGRIPPSCSNSVMISTSGMRRCCLDHQSKVRGSRAS